MLHMFHEASHCSVLTCHYVSRMISFPLSTLLNAYVACLLPVCWHTYPLWWPCEENVSHNIPCEEYDQHTHGHRTPLHRHCANASTSLSITGITSERINKTNFLKYVWYRSYYYEISWFEMLREVSSASFSWTYIFYMKPSRKFHTR